MKRPVYKLALGWTTAIMLSLLLHTGITSYVGTELNRHLSAAGETQRVELISTPPTEAAPPPPRLKFAQPPQLEPPASLITNRATVKAPNVPSPSLRAARGGNTPGPGSGSALPGPATGAKGTGLGDGADQFALYVEELREAGLDVIFLIDATGSMNWALAEVKSRVRDMTEWVRELVPISRFGVVAYRDVGDPEFVTRVQPLTYSTAKLETFLARLTAAGGGNLGESVLAGLQVAVKQAGWRPAGRRLIILIGDAPPHRAEAEPLLKQVAAFYRSGGQVTTLDVSDEANPALLEARLNRTVNRAMYRGTPSYDFKRIAQAGGGDAATLDGDIHLVRRIVSLIFGDVYSADLALALEALEPLAQAGPP